MTSHVIITDRGDDHQERFETLANPAGRQLEHPLSSKSRQTVVLCKQRMRDWKNCLVMQEFLRVIHPIILVVSILVGSVICKGSFRLMNVYFLHIQSALEENNMSSL